MSALNEALGRLGDVLGSLTLLTILGSALSNVLGDELRTRMDRVPRALIRLAARHLPAGMRADRIEEWEAELAAIAGQTEGLPLTRFVRGLRYASSLFLHAGSLTSALTDRSRFALTLAAGRRSLATLMHIAAGGYCLLGVFMDVRYSITDGLPADKAFSVLFFAGYGCLGAGALLHAASQWAPGASRLRRAARLLGVLGFAGYALMSTMDALVSGSLRNVDVGLGGPGLAAVLWILASAGLAFALARGAAGGAVPTAFLALDFVIRLAPELLGSFWISSTITLVPLLVVLARRHRGRAG